LAKLSLLLDSESGNRLKFPHKEFFCVFLGILKAHFFGEIGDSTSEKPDFLPVV